jgi:hypothetical protein
LPNSFQESSVLPLSLLVNFRFEQNHIEKRQEALAAFQNGFHENPRNYQPMGIKEIKFEIEKRIHSLSAKKFCKFKSFWCSAATNLSI